MGLWRRGGRERDSFGRRGGRKPPAGGGVGPVGRRCGEQEGATATATVERASTDGGAPATAMIGGGDRIFADKGWTGSPAVAAGIGRTRWRKRCPPSGWGSPSASGLPWRRRKWPPEVAPPCPPEIPFVRCDEVRSTTGQFSWASSKRESIGPIRPNNAECTGVLLCSISIHREVFLIYQPSPMPLRIALLCLMGQFRGLLLQGK